MSDDTIEELGERATDASELGGASPDAAPGAEVEVDPLVGQLLGERYRIEALLGSGGMGAVYRATHVHMKKAVAVKVLHKEMTFQAEVVKRFEREAVAAARIEHPNVATATDFGRLEDGAFYLVLEYVEGQSLGDLQKGLGRLPTERALRIARQIALALTAAHSAGIVHRDLKPDNVMLVERDGDPDFVKVLDFGIAKLHGEESGDQPALTRAGTVFGTPEYMAPEQAKGEPADARADLYTLGMILYEMLNGKSAFEADDIIVVLTQQMASPPPPLPDDVDPEVRALVMQLLEKDPGARVQTASELAAKFEAILGLPPASSVGYPLSAAAVSALGMAAPSGGGLESRVSGLAAKLQSIARPLSERARRRVALGPVTAPLWVLALPGALLVALVIALSTGGDGEVASARGSAEPGKVSASEPSRAADLGPLIKRARSGDRDALGELRAAVSPNEAPEAWRALGHGYARIQHYEGSLKAYETSLALDKEGTRDNELRADIRQMAQEKRYFEKALALAEGSMGADGVDLIYDVWLDLKKDKQLAQIADFARSKLDSPGIQAKASPALEAALAFEKSRSCADYKKVLAEHANDVDERSAAKLRRLQVRKGCGFLGLRDCWGCLRGSSDLSRAATNAQRPAPSFEAPRAAPAASSAR